MMPSKFSKIKVEDLLNDAPARGKTSHRPTPVQSDIFTIVCTVENCGKRFATSDALHAHQRRSHAAPTPFICRQCKSTFSSAANLNKHVRFQKQSYFPISKINLFAKSDCYLFVLIDFFFIYKKKHVIFF